MLPRQTLEQCYLADDPLMMQRPLYFQSISVPRPAMLSDYDFPQYIPPPQPRMVTVTPHSVLPLDEPIEAGSLGCRRRRTDSESGRSVTSAPAMKRCNVTWENMTDDERDEAQRQRRKEQAFKTALCDAFRKTGICSYGDACRFAHGENDLRLPAQPRGKAHPKYKTQLCDKYSANGHCPYGPRCQFIHKLKKGLPLLDYEVLLQQGKISPAREDEVTNDDNGFYHRRPTQNLDRKNKPQGRKLPFDEDYSDLSDVSRDGHVYPKMQVINIERAVQVSEGQPRSDSFGPVRNTRRDRRPLNGPDYLRRRDDHPASYMSKATSMQSLAHRGSFENAADSYIPSFKSTVDLSLIPEETEDNDMSLVLGQQKNPPQVDWSDGLFRRLSCIKEETAVPISGPLFDASTERSGVSEAELLVQSCDEELLAQGLYDNKYPNISVDELKQWKPMK